MQILDATQVLERYKELNSKRVYRAMYSTLWGGAVTDPALMTVPVDDHMVHRGDGVFEAVRITPVKLFLMKEHLQRLFKSAEAVGLKIPITQPDLSQILLELARAAGFLNADSPAGQEGMLRIFVSRGPGDFSPNPYTTVGAQIYVVATDFKALPKEKYDRGVSVMISKIPAKIAPFSQIKSCNYLPNVLMKKESVDHGFDFSIALNEEGCVCEGPTENIMLVNANNELKAPKFDYTLRGTTLVRVMKLAEKLKYKNVLVGDVSIDELMNAKEVMIVGTTLGVLPVNKIEDQKFENHDLAYGLNDLIVADMNKLEG